LRDLLRGLVCCNPQEDTASIRGLDQAIFAALLLRLARFCFAGNELGLWRYFHPVWAGQQQHIIILMDVSCCGGRLMKEIDPSMKPMI
jgi:hypothetical protein